MSWSKTAKTKTNYYYCYYFKSLALETCKLVERLPAQRIISDIYVFFTDHENFTKSIFNLCAKRSNVPPGSDSENV